MLIAYVSSHITPFVWLNVKCQHLRKFGYTDRDSKELEKLAELAELEKTSW